MDKKVTAEVHTVANQHPDIDASEIEVMVNSGEVTLTGSVDDRHQKRLAEDCYRESFRRAGSQQPAPRFERNWREARGSSWVKRWA
jgi:hypothetical protein